MGELNMTTAKCPNIVNGKKCEAEIVLDTYTVQEKGRADKRYLTKGSCAKCGYRV